VYFQEAERGMEEDVFRDILRDIGGAFNTAPGEKPDGFSLDGLRGLSVNARDHIVYAWMSELPVEASIVRFGIRVFKAGIAGGRQAAENAASDRGDEDTRRVLEASYKTTREADRLTGLLRFSPDGGRYIARCAPDCFILPALAEHFTLRFGRTPWAVVDEKRGLVLLREEGRAACLRAAAPLSAAFPPAPDPWEGLWKQYYKVINNESRNNPGLRKQFMPRRYWKYLNEVEDDCR
jgi:probable DNA metabolism protein